MIKPPCSGLCRITLKRGNTTKTVSVGAVVGMVVVGRVVGLVVEIVVAVGEETEKVMGHDVKLSLPGLSVLGLVVVG